MRAGRLKHRVIIESPADARDERGGVTKVWQTVGEVWAAVEPIRARERLTASQVVGDTTHKITLRYQAFPNLSERHRLNFGGRILHIAGPPINPDEDGEMWECFAVEETPANA